MYVYIYILHMCIYIFILHISMYIVFPWMMDQPRLDPGGTRAPSGAGEALALHGPAQDDASADAQRWWPPPIVKIQGGFTAH